MTDWQEPGTDDGRRHSTRAGAVMGLLALLASAGCALWIGWLAWVFLETSDSGGLLWLAAILVASPFWLALYREDSKARDRQLYGRMSDGWLRRNR